MNVESAKLIEMILTGMALLSAPLGTFYYNRRPTYSPPETRRKAWILSIALSGISVLALYLLPEMLPATVAAEYKAAQIRKEIKVEENHGYTEIHKGRETIAIIKNIIFVSHHERGYQVFIEETSGKIKQLFVRYADREEIIKDMPEGEKAWIQYNHKLFGWDLMEIHVAKDFEPAKFFR